MEHGRNRNSLADIEEQLSAVFDANPAVAKNAEGVSVIPGNELPAVLAELSSQYGVVLMTPAEELEMKELLVANPGIEVTPNQLLSLVAARTAASGDAPPPPPPKDDALDPRSDSSGASSPDTELRGRGEGTPSRPPTLSRTSSIGSDSHAPTTPQPSGRVTSASPFDSTLRQRSTPLSAAAPSAWTRKPLPASRRRKSDTGSIGGSRPSSDNESSPSVARNPRRPSMGGSNPSLPFPPSSFSASASVPISSDAGSHPSARRSHSFDQSLDMSQTLVTPDFSSPYLSKRSKNPVIKFHSSGSGSDTDPEVISDDEDDTHRYVRQALSSDASLAPQDIVEALQKTNAELSRKAADSERRMQNRLAERETEIADLEAQLDDLKTELSVSRREEKELRVKERANMTQFSTFESEIQKLQKSLDHARGQYSSMQKQYHEQCTETERMRNLLRRKEQEIKEADDRAYLHEGEVQKWNREREALEHSIETHEHELSVIRQAANELDEQKQENLLLKETIDRMRYDLDALRAGMGPSADGRQAQGDGTLSRSLANEIREGFERREREREKEEEEEAAEGIVVEEGEGEGSDDGYIETTITTSRKRKVGTRAKPIVRVEDGMMREYADAAAQHDESEFLTSSGVQHQHSEFSATSGVQHEAFVSSLGVQHDKQEFTAMTAIQTESMVLHDVEIETEPSRVRDAEVGTEPPSVQHVEIGTEPLSVQDMQVETESPGMKDVQTEAQVGVEFGVGTEPREITEAAVGMETPQVVERVMCEMEVQTDDLPAVASSSAPVPVPEPTPTPGPADLPPPYLQSSRETEQAVVKRWHPGLSERASSPEMVGASSQVREEWEALKRSAGVDCRVIDRIVNGKDVFAEGVEVVENVEVIEENVEGEGTRRKRARPHGRFNVYNTFIVRRGEGWWTSMLTQAVVGVGFWTLVAGVVGARYAQFDTPTYADRATWSAYNNYAGALGEGLVGRSVDNPIWIAIERLVVGAAVRVGPGLPT